MANVREKYAGRIIGSDSSYLGDGDYADYVLVWNGAEPERVYYAWGGALGGCNIPTDATPEVMTEFTEWAVSEIVRKRVRHLQDKSMHIVRGIEVVSTSKRSRKLPQGVTGFCGEPYRDGSGNAVVDVDTDTGRVWRVATSQMVPRNPVPVDVEEVRRNVREKVEHYIAKGSLMLAYYGNIF
jgi:hypothetical protein